MNKRPVVVKVGGSLLALKGLQRELSQLLDELGTHRVVLLTGGGPAVKALHQLGAASPFSEEEAHWHCIKLMGDLTRSLSETFPNSLAVSSWKDAEQAWQADRLPWFIVESFLRADDKTKDRLPSSWAVSSDSIAAHLAARYRADLLLLKACELPRRSVLATTLAKRGIVDSYFPQAVKKVKQWKVSNLPGGTAPEIALDLSQPWPDGHSPRKPVRARR